MTDYKEAYYLEKNRKLTKALLKIKVIASTYEYADVAVGKILGVVEDQSLESNYDPDNVPPDEP